MSFRRLARVIRPSPGPLGQLQRHAQWLGTVQEGLTRRLPADMAARVRVANLSGGTLTVLVDTPAWGTRLRFLEPRILEWLKSEGAFAQIARIKVRVRGAPHAPEEPATRAPVVARRCPAAAAALTAVAAEEEDPRLAAGLRRLAARLGGDGLRD